jgi:uncharacterized protein YjbI with pentapeptide repeats
VGRKKLVRKAEPPSNRRIAWPRWTGFRGMTVRDWLELLIVPLSLVVISFLFTGQQDQRQQQTENQRAEAERELAEQRAQDEALQAYLDQMSQLMLDRKLLEAEQGTPLYTLAQARTSTVILRLDAEHNESVTRFLINSGLAKSETSARLLREITLSHATLSDAYLPNADLSHAHLVEADLSGANLSGANLSHAHLSHAHLRGANLHNADLSGAYLSEAHLSNTNLINIDLSGAHLSHANLSPAFLGGANLSHANLSRATLDCRNLRGRRGNLSYANLNNLRGCTKEELRSAFTLKGATMPNGLKYEEWLKSKENRKNE